MVGERIWLAKMDCAVNNPTGLRNFDDALTAKTVSEQPQEFATHDESRNFLHGLFGRAEALSRGLCHRVANQKGRARFRGVERGPRKRRAERTRGGPHQSAKPGDRVTAKARRP